MTQQKKNNILHTLTSLKYMGVCYIDPINLNKIDNTKQQLPNDINNLQNIVSNCNLCKFSNTRKNILFGQGNPNANIIFLGLAPSNLDDENNDILSGNTGQMLSKMAQNILGLSINDIYVVNILKCLPSNITKFNDEIETCKPYLQKQIDIIKPKIIVVFGDAHKYISDYPDIKIISTYHPSFILRNPSFKKDVLEDLKKVKNIMESF
jgi:DNA polymerase